MVHLARNGNEGELNRNITLYQWYSKFAKNYNFECNLLSKLSVGLSQQPVPALHCNETSSRKLWTNCEEHNLTPVPNQEYRGNRDLPGEQSMRLWLGHSELLRRRHAPHQGLVPGLPSPVNPVFASEQHQFDVLQDVRCRAQCWNQQWASLIQYWLQCNCLSHMGPVTGVHHWWLYTAD